MRFHEGPIPGGRRLLGLILLSLLGIAPAVLMWHWVSSNWVPLPYWDEWHTPGAQFESWRRGTLTWAEMFSQHNESRKFFPRLLYFALERFGGWDERNVIRAEFVAAGVLGLLLLHLLRKTRGASTIGSLTAWALMMIVGFAPVQVKNFFYGIQIEPLICGLLVLAAATMNLSTCSFRAKALSNLALAFVATYTFANGMLLWVLAWPLCSPAATAERSRQWRWRALYMMAGVISIGSYFIGYQQPAQHPAFASILSRFWDLTRYLILWSGNYFASDFAGPFFLGVFFLILFFAATGFALWEIWRRRSWETFYPWLLLGVFAFASALITALGRVGFGVEQALDNRYVAFSRFFYLSLVGLLSSISYGRIRHASPNVRTVLLTGAGFLIGLLACLWAGSLEKFARAPSQHRKLYTHLLHTLEWMESIPDNPDLALILPFADVLKSRARLLEKEGVLRLSFIHGELSTAVRQAPPVVSGKHGVLDGAELQPDEQLQVSGWAWLPERHRRADCVILGVEDGAGGFKPVAVLETGVRRSDLRTAARDPHILHAGFSGRVKMTNFPPRARQLKGWAIDRRAQKAWPLAGSISLPPSAAARNQVSLTRSFARAQLETGCDPLLQPRGKGEQSVESRGRFCLAAPEFRPLPQSGVGHFRQGGGRGVALPHGLEERRDQKSEHESGRKIAAHLTALDGEVAEPFPHAILGGVVIMVRRFVQRLQESGVYRDSSARLQDPVDLACGQGRLAQVLKDVKGKHLIEASVSERQ